MTTPKTLCLWDFSLATYSLPQIADACLHLQDSHGVNVNVLLWSHWLGMRQIALTVTRLELALATIAHWDIDCVQALRQLRRNIKHEFVCDIEKLKMVALREEIKRAELLAEKYLQQCLENLSAVWQMESSAVAIVSNMQLYLDYLKLPPLAIEQATMVFTQSQTPRKP